MVWLKNSTNSFSGTFKSQKLKIKMLAGLAPSGGSGREPIHASLSFFCKDFIYLFLDRGERREKERERNINVWLPLAHPSSGTWPTTQACPLTGNQTSDPLVCRPVFNSLSHTSQGSCLSLNFWWLSTILHIPWLVDASLQTLPQSSYCLLHHDPPCHLVCLL